VGVQSARRRSLPFLQSVRIGFLRWGRVTVFKLSQSVVCRNFHPHVPLVHSDIIPGNGIYSVTNQLFHVLLDPAEAVLISSPYYVGFDTMITKRTQGLVIGVPLQDTDDRGILEEGDVECRFGAALNEAREAGLTVSARLMPMNTSTLRLG
jgi:hypothetical protein